MINNEELQISNRSYINKDFQTIYPELVELVKKLTSRWSPDTTNESDPLLVLLKLLGFMGDKLNYNVDKNILEAFLPSATQESSVISLLETNGYTKKYYQSASTTISILYSGVLSSDKSIYLKAFETQFTDENNSITYTLLQDINLLNTQTTYTGLITEGTPKDLSINGNTSIQLSNLDENYRLYFPETLVAQNRIYVKNVESNDWNTDGNSGDGWSQVSNLNLYSPKSKNFKFGFDSNKNLPYIQFPDDIIELIGNGLNVRYIVTVGNGGNVSRGRLTVMSNPTSDNLYYWNGSDFTEDNVVYTDETNNQNLLRIFNYYASTNGADPETINEAYNNYKKTVGTFDTLVTPRDFANWLYRYTDPETTYSIVSNIQVSDRRIDTTFYQPVVTYNEYGATTDYTYVHDKGQATQITPYDLVLYPLKQVNTFAIYDQNGILKSDNYDDTFTADISVIPTLINVLQDTQSIDHTFITVNDNGEPYLYKNMYTLNVKVSTIDKVNEIDRRIIVNNIKQALFDNFNSRKVDYGYEIPVDTIYDVILNADTRIKNVFLDDPVVNTKAICKDGTDYGSGGAWYIDMVARNVLAGRVNLYEYLDNFKFNYTMSNPSLISNIATLTPELTLTNPNEYKLKTNQVVQLFSDSFSVATTATVGVNYYWSGDPLDANKPHKIIGTECLYISYTNSDDVLKTYKYTEDSIITYDNSGIQISSKPVENNLIQPTFLLDATGINGIISVPGMSSVGKFNQLSSNQEIQFLKKNEKVFNENTYLFYWKVNNSENRLFQENEKEIILGEEEYFMYTDTSKSGVEIFSSGTKITRVGLSYVNWECTPIDTSELVDGDLSTYAGINWVSIDFTSNNTLAIAQQTILTLTEGDYVTFGGEIESEPYDLVDGDTFSYKFGESDDYTDIDYDDLHNYRVRTRLDVVCGPDLPQTILSGDSVATETIKYALVSTPETLIDLSGTFITNYLIQRSGNGIIDTRLEGAEFNIVQYTQVSAPNTQSSVETQGSQYLVEFKKLDWTSTPTVEITIPKISSKNSVFMVYFNKTDNNDSVTFTNATTSTLVNGVNMITADSDAGHTTITFTFASTQGATSKSFVVIDEVKILDGVNSIFNLDASGETALLTKISALSGDIGFYSTYVIPYAKQIDIEDFTKPEVMWDKNNVLNKFTLPQIDFSTSRIDVSKSSLK